MRSMRWVTRKPPATLTVAISIAIAARTTTSASELDTWSRAPMLKDRDLMVRLRSSRRGSSSADAWGAKAAAAPIQRIEAHCQTRARSKRPPVDVTIHYRSVVWTIDAGAGATITMSIRRFFALPATDSLFAMGCDSP